MLENMFTIALHAKNFEIYVLNLCTECRRKYNFCSVRCEEYGECRTRPPELCSTVRERELLNSNLECHGMMLWSADFWEWILEVQARTVDCYFIHPVLKFKHILTSFTICRPSSSPQTFHLSTTCSNSSSFITSRSYAVCQSLMMAISRGHKQLSDITS